MIGTWRDDVASSLRTMRRAPGFTCTAGLVLSLGFAITGTVFSTINGWLSVGHAIPHAERLVFVSPTERGGATRGYFKESSYTRLFDLRLHTVRDLFAAVPSRALLSVDAGSVPVRIEAVTGSYFRALGVPPLLGRVLHPDDDRAGSSGAVVLREAAWRRLFAGDPRVIGRPVRLSGVLCTVVGVMPDAVRGFDVPTSTVVDVWAPVAAVRSLLGDTVWGPVFGRLAEGAALGQAQAEMRVAARRIDTDDAELGAAVMPVERGAMPGRVRLAMGAVGTGLVAVSSLVLLIACANLANLLLARSASRASDVAIRMALGAGPARIVRLQFLETGSVGIIGGAAGFAIVCWVSRLTGRFSIPLAGTIGTGSVLVDVWVLAYFFVLIASVAVGIGILPAMRAIHTSPGRVLGASGSRGPTTGRFERMRTLLVASQVAASTVLLIVAGLFVRSALHASSYRVAFNAGEVALTQVQLSHGDTNERREQGDQEALLAAVRSIPGVRGAAVSSGLPARGGGDVVAIEAVDAHLGDRQFGPACHCLSASPGFFDVVGARRLRGRDFTAMDTAGARGVVIVNEVARSRLWPGRDAIGRQLRIRKGTPLDVIGVVAETDRTAQDTSDRCFVFVPAAQRYTGRFTLSVSAVSSAASLLGPLAATVAHAVPDAAIFDLSTADTYLNRAGGPSRAIALALVSLGALGLTIAVVGLYGVMTYVVGLRRAEFGVRKVLGATDAQIYRLVSRDACRMLLLGILAGLPIAYVVSASAAHALVGVTAHDALTYLVVPACLVLVGVVAAWWPAHRAARVEPAVALRDL